MDAFEDEFRRLPDSSRTATDALTGLELDLYDPCFEENTTESRLEKARRLSIFNSLDTCDKYRLISEECEYTESMDDNYVCDSQGFEGRHIESSYSCFSEMTIEDNEGNKYSGYWWDSSCRKAIEDFSKAIYIDGQNALAYFSRANIRYKKLEFSVNNETEENANTQDTYRYEYEMIMRDYDKVIELAPDFAFVWYNRANLLAHQKDYQAAVVNYTKAIELEDDFSEAYFNRALTYLLLNQRDKAINDLSKAGELGIYKAYSILKKIQNK